MRSRWFGFPNPVNETSARLVAAGVVLQAVVYLVVQQWWVLIPLVYGFLARVLAGPRFSPLGQFVSYGMVAGPDSASLLQQPSRAIQAALARAGKTVADVDLFEINEAFAVVAEKFIRDLNLDRDKVNVNGGAMALGHPIGATGSMLIGTVLDELERRDQQFGLVTMCAAGGMAPAIIIERIWRSLKYEEVYLRAYDTVADAKRWIYRYIERYNTIRPHSSLGGKTPDKIHSLAPAEELLKAS